MHEVVIVPKQSFISATLQAGCEWWTRVTNTAQLGPTCLGQLCSNKLLEQQLPAVVALQYSACLITNTEKLLHAAQH